MFESRGMRLVRESVGNKSAKFYRPCLKLRSIQSEVVPNKGIHHKKIQTDDIAELKAVDSCWICSAELSDTFRSLFVYGKEQES